MTKLTLLLVVAALGLAGWQAWEASTLRDDIQAQNDETASLRGDVDRLAKEVASLSGIEAPAALLREPTAGSGTGAGPGGADEATLAARGASPEVLARQVRDLQSELAGMKEETARLEEKVGDNPFRGAFKRPKFIRDVASAKKLLDLNARQEADIGRIVDDTKRDLEDIWSIPNEKGETWKEVSQMKVSSGSEGLAIVMSNMAKQQEFRNSTIPGRNETYGEADSRIKERGRSDVKSVLTPEQVKTFDDAHTDSMFGSPSGNNVISFSTVTTTTTESSDD